MTCDIKTTLILKFKAWVKIVNLHWCRLQNFVILIYLHKCRIHTNRLLPSRTPILCVNQKIIIPVGVPTRDNGKMASDTDLGLRIEIDGYTAANGLRGTKAGMEYDRAPSATRSTKARGLTDFKMDTAQKHTPMAVSIFSLRNYPNSYKNTYIYVRIHDIHKKVLFLRGRESFYICVLNFTTNFLYDHWFMLK